MEIKTVTTKEVVEEKEINTPSFWKYGAAAYPRFAAIYSEERVITLMAPSAGYADVTMGKLAGIYQPERVFAGSEITEQEFNELLAKSLFIISGVEVCTPVEQLY